jgi:hypothetical protein
MSKRVSQARPWKKVRCGLCGEKLEHEWDLIVYNKTDNAISEIEFRHQTKCDDRRFFYSRHVKDGYDHLLKAWFGSPFYGRVPGSIELEHSFTIAPEKEEDL